MDLLKSQPQLNSTQPTKALEAWKNHIHLNEEFLGAVN